MQTRNRGFMNTVTMYTAIAENVIGAILTPENSGRYRASNKSPKK